MASNYETAKSSGGSETGKSSQGRVLAEEIKRLLKEQGQEASNTSGNSGLFIQLSDLNHLSEGIAGLIPEGEQKNTSLSAVDVEKLTREIAQLKHSRDVGMSREQFFEKQFKEAKEARAKANMEVTESARRFAELRKKTEDDSETLHKELKKLKEANSKLKKELLKLKKEGDDTAQLMLSARQKETAAKITEVNNALAKLNSELDKEREKSRRLAKHVLEISTLYTEAKAQLIQMGSPIVGKDNKGGKRPDPGPRPDGTTSQDFKSGKKSFFQVAMSYREWASKNDDKLKSEGKLKGVQLWMHMDPGSLASMIAAEKTDRDDVRNRLFHIVKTVNGIRHPGVAPYKKWLNPLFDEVKLLNWESRLQFRPFVDEVWTSLCKGSTNMSESKMLHMMCVDFARLQRTDGTKFDEFGKYVRQAEGTDGRNGPQDFGEPPVEESFARFWHNLEILAKTGVHVTSQMRAKLVRQKRRLSKWVKLRTGTWYERLWSYPYGWYIRWFGRPTGDGE